MNAELLAKAHPHLREEWRKLRAVNGTLERALQQAAAAAGRGPDELPGRPPALDAGDGAWFDYFLGEGAKAYYEELQLDMGAEMAERIA